jgi:hypothetical protein
MACSGIHRELNMRVKGIGASTFSQEEVDKLKETSNDQVNAVYLARYNPAVERLEAPTNNYDQQRLRVWIRRKYHDKAWYGMDPQPTRVQIPPKQEAKAQDLLGFSGAPAPTPAAPASQQWDAFNGSSQQQQQQQQVAFPADFGSSQTKQQQNFAAFGQQPPPPHQQQQNFAAFGQQPAQQQNFADFGQQQNFASFGQQQPSQQQQQGQFLNYAGQTQLPPSQPQPQAVQFANFGQQQQQFANFPQSSQQQVASQPGTYEVQQQPGMPDHQAGFGTFSQHQGAMQPLNQGQQPTGGLGNFSQQGVGAPVQMQAPAPPVPPSVTHEAVSETIGDRISDAFSNLSVTPSKPKESPANPVGTKGKAETKYSSGGSAIYTSNGDKSVVKIIKVHLDHELEPFYTIQLPDGREKQTDDAHLSDFVETAEAKVIANLLIDLDVTQLKKVVEFVRSLKSANGSDSSNNTPPMLDPSIPSPHMAPPPMPSPAMPPSLSIPPMPPAPNMAPPAAPLSPPATVPAPAQMGQMFAPATGGMMGMPSGMSAEPSMIPSPNPGSNQTQGDGVPMGGVPAPPLYQQPGMGQPMSQQQPPQQQYMQQPPPLQQQYMQQQPPQQQQHMQQQPPQQQHMQQQPPQLQQYMHQPPPQQQQYMQHMPPQPQAYMQKPTQQYMQQQAMSPQEAPPQQMSGGTPMSPRGNPFDLYH